jgi:Na+/proline symporter
MGLTALAMEDNPSFPTYPVRMADADVSAGLVLPYAAVSLLGKGGAVGTLLIVFMAVTSATSSQLIAVSTICTYDLYRTYFNPTASGKRLIYTSHAVVCGYGLFIATFSVGLWYAGISMGYLYLMMGVIISAAVLPATLTLVWAGQNKWAASLSPILGLASALIAWLVTAKRECGNLGVVCTGSNYPMLAGNVAALLSPVVLVAIFTLIFGIDKYDWKSMMEIRRGDDHELTDAASLGVEGAPAGETNAEFDEEQKKLERAGKISKTATVVMTLAFLVLWPMPMYGTGYIFSKPFFTGWVTVGIIWIFCSFIGVGLFPVFESRKTLARTVKSIYLDITGKSHPKTIHAQMAQGEQTPGDDTPSEKSGVKQVVGSV